MSIYICSLTITYSSNSVLASLSTIMSTEHQCNIQQKAHVNQSSEPYLNGGTKLEELIHFHSMVPCDVALIAPTIYARLNLVNYCQHIAAFTRMRNPLYCECSHSGTFDARVAAVKRVIAKIVETNTVFAALHQNASE
uniref:DNA packaging n=1 Tax=Otarine gammaherpesvirus 4 TaxID=2801541 RepID=A0A889IWD7_9GAMA|nr:DNA packaging [Otarine gammaherpesvirus 4]